MKGRHRLEALLAGRLLLIRPQAGQQAFLEAERLVSEQLREEETGEG